MSVHNDLAPTQGKLDKMDSAKILLVDDETHILNGYRRGLCHKFALDTANSGLEAIDRLAQNSDYAVVVTDMRMPGMNGLELLSQVRKLSPDIARIMLTGNSDQQTVIDAVNQGEVCKFLTKPCNLDTLESAIADGIQQHRLAKTNQALLKRNSSRIKGLAKKLAHQSLHDPLTGLDNRHSFEIRLTWAIESSQKEDLIHAVCYLDLDHFHVINGSYGTATGDAVLQQLAKLLTSKRHKDDMVARLSDDKFGILLSKCSLEDACEIVEQLQQQIRIFSFGHEGHDISISASMGLIPITNSDSDIAAIIRKAEASCALAKESGRNLLHIADPSDQELKRRLNEMLVASDINRALKEDRFQLYYQPITPIASGKSEGQHLELLLRMLDADGKIHLPSEFLPAAEHYHLSPQIDCWVICSAASWLENHPEQLQKISSCSINLSGLSLGSSVVMKCITQAFESGGVPKNKVCFEVTETAAILKLDLAIEFISALKAQGFMFSLDDFGSGYSSFNYLKSLPVDYLKIDGAFVKNISSDKVSRSMVKSIHEIGQAMGIKTIAEFVENQDILNCLEGLQIDYAQGYLIARPRPLDDLK